MTTATGSMRSVRAGTAAAMTFRYPQPWRHVQSVRKPPKERKFSELGPKARRERGIEESYGYGE